ncbi:hypothetical protein NQZ68_035927 [Dissostichus eleginoides]|nr:hypothetical protein NQZ68_035927 [Dissostichus eleginoides]
MGRVAPGRTRLKPAEWWGEGGRQEEGETNEAMWSRSGSRAEIETGIGGVGLRGGDGCVGSLERWELDIRDGGGGSIEKRGVGRKEGHLKKLRGAKVEVKEESRRRGGRGRGSMWSKRSEEDE